ncbi:MAG: tRNA (guanosine(37)-N1)-methyltransferase TrmD [Tenericutes bacterium HGW-Tenericutes-6]|nr:MAG: tRNA (guanosine(37)-N1)-methyltransferase TrmD [Tenericutes bacterium HGW-Tenericutes-6]
MIIDIITVFPDFFDIFLNTSIIKHAVEDNQVVIRTHQLRDFSTRKHNKIDDTPYGGGAGMLMQFPPFYEAIKKLKKENAIVILLSPQGTLFTQQKAIEISKAYDQMILLCGHYEGIDARVESLIDLELSIGDYVLTGGEIPAMILTDAVTRLLPGVLTDASRDEDSLQNGWLKYPQYTKPSHYKGYEVPEVLLSGHHEKIDQWRKEKMIDKTLHQRPDLLKNIQPTLEEKKIIEKLKKTNEDT